MTEERNNMIEQMKHFFSVPPPEGLRTAIERDLGIEQRYYFLRWEWNEETRIFTIFLPQMGMELHLTWPPEFTFVGTWMLNLEEEEE